MKKIALVFVLFVVFGCGYKPVSKVAKNVLGEKIYAYVSINIQDPKNSVIIQDAVKDAIVSRFGYKLVSKKEATSSLYVSIKSVEFVPMIYDENGYVISYKTKVVLHIDSTFKDKQTKSYDTYGEYNFPIQSNSVISDTKRFEAIKYSSLSALDEYIAFIGIKGVENGKYDK